MSGHSHWAGIKHKKAAKDAKRGKVWSKIARLIIVAAKGGGGDPSQNLSLRYAVDKAKAANMPKDTIERAIKRGAGDTDVENYEEIRYEGYGPGGVAVMVDCMTDNRNRTASEVRHAFSKCGGNLGTDGSVSYMFKKSGVISFEAGTDEDAATAVALDAGAEDLASYDDGSFDLLTSPEAFADIKDALAAAGFEPVMAEVTMRPDTLSALDAETAEKVMKMINMLEDLDDVQEVYTNADIPEAVMEALG